MNPTRSAPCLMLTALFASPAFAAPAGEVSGENDTVVKKDMKKGETIKPHAHENFRTVLFAVGKGRFDATLNTDEKHPVGAGEVLKFGGRDVIEAVARENSSVKITLVK
ncbi:hypothetical protein [Neisseria sp. oral taxon 014]|uniref:hypothetical protein n=1 Tax=Neisseria sp. oral taxon 014 TaxID=641148 RepID=UPI0025F39613|nr:hypothetical protein [Neisseria sp. oral taxon 014]